MQLLFFLGIIAHRLINVTITKPTKRRAMIVVKVSQRPPAQVTTTTNCTVTAIIISRETVAQEVRKESQKNMYLELCLQKRFFALCLHVHAHVFEIKSAKIYSPQATIITVLCLHKTLDIINTKMT